MYGIEEPVNSDFDEWALFTLYSLKINDYDRLISWAELFETSTLERKKMIVAQLVNEIHVTKEYKISIEFNISFEQFLSMVPEENRGTSFARTSELCRHRLAVRSSRQPARHGNEFAPLLYFTKQKSVQRAE